MKMKFLLGAIVALVVSQSMQAIQVMFLSGNPKGTVGIGLTGVDANNPDAERYFITDDLTFRQNHTFSLGNLSIDNWTMTFSNGTYYVVKSEDLAMKNIPTSGNHDLGIHIIGDSGKLEIVIDKNNSRVVVIEAKRLQQ